jgi:hypothetical protein
MPSESTTREQTVPTSRLWFGVVGSTLAWFSLGLADMFITWRACVHEEQFGGASSHPGARVLYFVAGISLLALTGVAGFMSYKDWHRLSGLKDLLSAEAYERKEFMALAGLFISFTLGFGMVWLFLPVFIIEMCLRVR